VRTQPADDTSEYENLLRATAHRDQEGRQSSRFLRFLRDCQERRREIDALSCT